MMVFSGKEFISPLTHSMPCHISSKSFCFSKRTGKL
jgi:hypothetical protein